MKNIFISAALMMLLCGCFSKAPTSQEAIGQYQLSNESRVYLKHHYNDLVPDRVEVRLEADGIAELVNIPELMVEQVIGRKFLSATGTWEIDDNGLCIYIRSGELPKAFYANGFLDVQTSRRGVVLVSTLGDPDSGNSLTFEKR
jgi:hypothetical protein